MTSKITGAMDFRQDLARHLHAAEHCGEATVVTKYGKPIAVLMSNTDLLCLAAELKFLRESLYGKESFPGPAENLLRGVTQE